MHAWRFSVLSRNFSSLQRHKFSKLPSKYKPIAIREAQQALTEYLHCTRSLPFAYAEHISKNSLNSLSNLIANVDFSVSNFSKSVRKFLSYHPINEFEFFYESIGIDCNEIGGLLPTNKIFFSEDDTVLNAASLLAAFGFPWNKLGTLFKGDSSIFSRDANVLKSRLCMFKQYGFSNTLVVGICLAFPCVLSGELGADIDALFGDLKRVFVDFPLGDCVEGNLDAWLNVCVKIRVFYDLGIEKGKIADILDESKNIFVDYPLEILIGKINYFCRFGVSKADVALLLLKKTELLSFNLDSPLISVKGILKHFGFRPEELEAIAQKFPHVFGRNKMANLPHVMRAMDLHLWFFNKIKDEDHKRLASYAVRDPDEGFEEFNDCLEKIRASRTPIHSMQKVGFLQGIGFGENGLAVKVLNHLHGTSSELQERFDCLLRLGIPFSNLCTMIRIMPKILNQKPEILEQKVNFLCQEIGASLQELDVFPAFLCFNLEKRIKPRYRFHMWLREKGFTTQKYSISSIVATSEKNFIKRLRGIHPAAPQYWYESLTKEHHLGNAVQ